MSQVRPSKENKLNTCFAQVSTMWARLPLLWHHCKHFGSPEHRWPCVTGGKGVGQGFLGFYFILLFFVILGLHLLQMEVPRLGVSSELQLLTCATAIATWNLSCVFDLHNSSQQCWILNPLIEARVRTRVLMDTSWVRDLCATMGTHSWEMFSY